MYYVIFPSLGDLPRSHSCYIIVLGFNPIYVRPQSPVLKHYNITLLWQSTGRKMSSHLSCIYMVAELRQHILTCRKWPCRTIFKHSANGTRQKAQSTSNCILRVCLRKRSIVSGKSLKFNLNLSYHVCEIVFPSSLRAADRK